MSLWAVRETSWQRWPSPPCLFQLIDLLAALEEGCVHLVPLPRRAHAHGLQLLRGHMFTTHKSALELVPLLVLGVKHDLVHGVRVVLGLVGHIHCPLLQLVYLLAVLEEGGVRLAHLGGPADALGLQLLSGQVVTGPH